MDPNEIKLTTAQKIIPLFKAINEEIPWQLAVLFALSLTSGIVLSGMIGAITGVSAFWDFALRRLVCGFFISGFSFLFFGFIFMVIDEKILPLYRRISKNYENEAYEAKKKVLDNIIDDEILK